MRKVPARAADELRRIPGIGPSLARDLRELGVLGTEDLAGRDPTRLYERLGKVRGARQDPCVLYTFRCAVYFARTPNPEPELLKWWNWKGRELPPPGKRPGGRAPRRTGSPRPESPGRRARPASHANGIAGPAPGQGRPDAFTPAMAAFTGKIVLPADVERVFPLFSPLGEKAWVPGWDPRLLHPPGSEWEEGMIFLTREEEGDAVWIVTRLDRPSHEVVYHRVEAGRYVARIKVRCRDLGGRKTEATVVYAYVGLSEDGNRDLMAMTSKEYGAKMGRWRKWIQSALAAS